MGAGLSMASVNKIKELANSREYGLAIELVEHQDLTKSLNPQFLRLCGEIYIKSNRLEDARRCLIMAHRLGPESKRIIYVFVDLYLRMGYFDLAKTYYDMYMFDLTGHDSRQMEYIWNKHRIIAEGTGNWKELEPLLAGYAHNLDQDWSFELFLLYRKEGKDAEADSLAQLYSATYRNSDLSQVMSEIQTGAADADAYFMIYPAQAGADEDPAFEQLRAEERELLEADDLRMHPKEAEITVMYEDAFTPAESEKTVQRMLKRQDKDEQREEKRQRKKEKHEEKLREKQRRKNRKPDGTEPSEIAEPIQPKTAEPIQSEAPEKPATNETGASGTVQPDAPETEKPKAVQPDKMDTMVASEEPKAVQPDVSESETLSHADQTTDVRTEEAKLPNRSDEEEERLKAEALKVWLSPDDEEDQTTGRAKNMKRKGIITIEEDDGFEAEADTVEELARKEASETEYAETADMQDASETAGAHAGIAESTESVNKKPAFVFQTVELAPEEQNDGYEVDDFTEQADDEFGEMHSYTQEEPEAENPIEAVVEEAAEPELVIEEVAEPEEVEPEPAVEEPVEVEPEPEIEEVAEPEEAEPEPEAVVEEVAEPEPVIEEPVEVEPEPEIEEVAEPEPVIEEPVEVEPEPEIEEVAEPEEAEPEPVVEEPAEVEPESAVEEIVEPEPEPVVEEVEEPEEAEPEPEPVVEEAVEIEPEITMEEVEEPEPVIEEVAEPEEAEPEPEAVVEEVVEAEPEPEIEEVAEPEPEMEEVEELEPVIEEVAEPEEAEPEPEFHVAPFTTKPEKKKLDFPVFRSSLFPDYHNETKQVENNFDEIMEQAHDKMSANMQKEEQMQREAEALLASLGISLDSPPAGTVGKKEQPPQKKGPSRDEMKASLKIDSVKKDLLKRIKEYR